MVAINTLMSNAGKLLSSRGNVQVFERIVYPQGGKDYRVLTSFKNGKPFKEIISGKEFSLNEKFHSLASSEHTSCDRNEKYLRSIPNKVRQMWNEAFKDMGWFGKYGDARVIPNGHKTIVKNFETGETTTIVNSWAQNSSIYSDNGADGLVRMLSSQTKQNGKVAKEYGRVFVNADEGVIRDISTRTYVKNNANQSGNITLESTLRGSKYDPNGTGGYGAWNDLWTGGAKKGQLPRGTVLHINGSNVSTTLPADKYDTTKHYLSYHV